MEKTKPNAAKSTKIKTAYEETIKTRLNQPQQYNTRLTQTLNIILDCGNYHPLSFHSALMLLVGGRKGIRWFYLSGAGSTG